ncbi:chloride channel protein clh-3-like [Tachypleus tridentatus]|uniref:chloride channel protein clh-3-like n=1 Tax=Tachypleus tridentatus TaxID=6853 RepID=UPI003FCFFD4B
MCMIRRLVISGSLTRLVGRIVCEGPFVHVASTWPHYLVNLRLPSKNDSRTSEMLAAVCAVGTACSFAAS